MRLSDRYIIASWKKLQSKHSYPVNALGKPIHPNNRELMNIWRKYGIYKSMNPSLPNDSENSTIINIKSDESSDGLWDTFVRGSILLILIIPVVIFLFPIIESEDINKQISSFASNPTFDNSEQKIETLILQESDINTTLNQSTDYLLKTDFTPREYRLYIAQLPYSRELDRIAKITGIEKEVFSALFWAETDLTHFWETEKGQEVVTSCKSAWGISQITEPACDGIDLELDFYRKVEKIKKDILFLYGEKRDLRLVSQKLPDVGINYIVAVLETGGYNLKRASKIIAAIEREKRYEKQEMKFSSVEEAKKFDKLQMKKISVLKQLIGEKLDRERTKKDPIYCMDVGSAYFYLDYLIFASMYPWETYMNKLEMAVGAYNTGNNTMVTIRDKYKAEWRNYKPDETKQHWERFSEAYRVFKSIAYKVSQ